MTRLVRSPRTMTLASAFAFAVLAVSGATARNWFPAAVYGVLAAGWTGAWVFAMRSDEARLRSFVLSWLADHPGERFSSLELGRELGLGKGSAPLHPILWQLELDGLVRSGWDPLEPGKTYRRRWYTATTARGER